MHVLVIYIKSLSMNIEVNVLRVFVNENGDFGNPVGIVLDEPRRLDDELRQKIAAQLGYSETVFIDDLSAPTVSLFNPKYKVEFAGHAVLGVAYFINRILGRDLRSVRCGQADIAVIHDQEHIHIRAPLSVMPPWNIEQVGDALAVERLSANESSQKMHTVVWAWMDKNLGTVRARTFAPDWGIPEDEANGSGSMKLASTLGRNLEILHGKGSMLYVKPWKSNFADLGGRVVEE